MRSKPFLTQLTDLLGLGQHLWTMQWLGDEVCGVNLDPYKSIVYHRAQILVPHAFEEHERAVEAAKSEDVAVMWMGGSAPARMISDAAKGTPYHHSSYNSYSSYPHADHMEDAHDTTAVTDHTVENIIATMKTASAAAVTNHGTSAAAGSAGAAATTFRLYGALLGAQLTATEGLEEMSDPFVDRAAEHFPNCRPLYEDANVLAISSVMLASTLNSRVFQRTATEHIVP